MALVKRTYVDGETIITAQNLNDIQDEIISHANTFVPKTRTINSKALDANITLTASDLGAVPTTRTVNSKALSSNITLTAADVSAVPTTRTVNSKALSSNITLTAADVSAVPTTRTVNSKALSSDITLAAADIGYNSTDVGAELGSLNGAINLAQNNIAFVESGTTATRTYMLNRFVIVGGQLYITTDVITSGSTFINGTNITPVNLASRLEAVSITDDITVDTTKAADVVGRRYGNLVMISGGIVASSDAAGFVTNIPKVSGVALGLTLINSTGLPLTTGGVWLERNATQLNFYGSCPSRCTFQVIYITDY